jgi:glycine cleavage system H protein
MNIPKDCRYTREHEWARNEAGVVTVGITDYAQDKLGEIVFVELPAENEEVRKDEPFGVVESTKNASDVLAPMNGKVLESNEMLEDNPELINNDPYDNGWLVKLQPTKQADFDALMSDAEYAEYVEQIENDDLDED